jgi:hypothetical protein
MTYLRTPVSRSTTTFSMASAAMSSSWACPLSRPEIAQLGDRHQEEREGRADHDHEQGVGYDHAARQPAPHPSGRRLADVRTHNERGRQPPVTAGAGCG